MKFVPPACQSQPFCCHHMRHLNIQYNMCLRASFCACIFLSQISGYATFYEVISNSTEATYSRVQSAFVAAMIGPCNDESSWSWILEYAIIIPFRQECLSAESVLVIEIFCNIQHMWSSQSTWTLTYISNGRFIWTKLQKRIVSLIIADGFVLLCEPLSCPRGPTPLQCVALLGQASQVPDLFANQTRNFTLCPPWKCWESFFQG